jgi:hypothetical protein
VAQNGRGSVLQRRGAGDRDDRHLPGVLAGGQATEPATQPQLRLPRPGHDLGWQASLAAAQLQGGRGPVLVGPGRLDQLGAQMAVAGLGDATPVAAQAAGILAWDQAAEAHELRGAGQPAPVTDLASQSECAQVGHASVGGQAGHGVGEWWLVIPGGQVGLDGVQGGVAGRQGRPVVGVGRRQGRVVKALGQQPPLVGKGPGGGATAPDAAVAQQEPAQAKPSPGPVGQHVGPGPAQVPHRLLGHGGHTDRDQLAGAVQPSQPPAVAAVGLDPITGGLGNQRGRDHLAADVHAVQQAGQLIAGGAGLIAGSQPAGISKPRHEPADRRLVVGDPVNGRRLLPSRAKHRHRDRIPVHVQTKVGETTSSSDTGHRPAPSVCGSVHASVDDPRDTRNGAGRSHAD